MARVWHAKQATIKIDLASNVTITTAANLDSFFSTGTAIQGSMKDITVTQPMPDAEKIDLLGTDTSGFQNAEHEEKPAAQVEVTGTLILSPDESIQNYLGDAGEAITGGSFTATRYRMGKASIRQLALLIDINDDVDRAQYAGDNMIPAASEVRVTGADGHFETTMTLKCLARDWFGPEIKD